MSSVSILISPVAGNCDVSVKGMSVTLSLIVEASVVVAGPATVPPVSYTHLTLPTNREV